MQIVRDVRIKKTIDNKRNLYGDPFMAVVDLVERGDSYMEQTGMLVGNFEFNP